jgi:hypothetical protein
LKPTLQALKEYQDVISRIAALDEALAFVPPEIVELEKEWRGTVARIEELEKKKAEQEAKVREQKGLLEDATEKSKKYDDDLQQVTNNKEYHAVLKEIDAIKKKINSLTDDISQRQKDLEEIKANMDECGQLEKESKTKYDKDLAAHKKQMAESRKEREKRLKEREVLADKIPQRVMSQFQRIADRRGGIGLSVVEGLVCKACNVRVRHHVADQLRRSNRIMTCESCKRILVISTDEA